ncbi:restriction endonuclease subunit S [Proteus vulgaris]|uniref:restriction endonuclease subunit S n=1 Tax=Proteus TaxID=583 RepID=UPI0018E461C4|nr:restriction endonuclease subunit S [Proteus sp. PR00174]MBI6512971.1 restriction endonuclease subunit S [Proteus sp. PR00174]
MSEWQKIQLGSVVKNISETYKFTDSQVIFLNTSDVYNNKILHSTYSSPDILPGQAKKRIKNGDLLFSEIRPVNKRFSIVNVYNPERYVVSTKLMVLRCTPKIDIEYLRFLLTSQEQLEYLQMIAEDRSGTFPQITFEHISSIWVELPPFDEQKAITSVLSSLDNKIDLLHRQNKTLEAMAETLFRQWFVEEAQNDWVHGALKDEFAFTMGQSPKGSSFNEEQIGTPMFQGNADFGFRFPKERVYTTEPTRFAQKLDTLISVRAPVGAQNMARSKCCIGRGVAAFRHINNPDWYTYTYFKLRYLMDEIKKFNDEGTVFGSISKSDFEKIEVIIPPVSIIHNYEIMVKPLNDRVITNCFQIEKLENLRDTLLPKLMSGEVRVNYTPEEIKQ